MSQILSIFMILETEETKNIVNGIIFSLILINAFLWFLLLRIYFCFIKFKALFFEKTDPWIQGMP